MITQKRLKELFLYDENTGLLTWKINRGTARAGSIAGHKSLNGYLRTSADGKRYLNHRIIWCMIHGYIPENGLDHIDRDKLNNRIDNLREVSQTCNMRNRGMNCNNTSGVKGVYLRKKTNKWYAMIRSGKINRQLCTCQDFVEAVAHRLSGEQCLGWEGCDSCSPAYRYMKDYLSNTSN